ncbi:hypothetical protein [Phaeobacter sp. C3_T13_0]|uniref:hypothetical protein n=1 Tax=Phaeobacter cretensis TaxID=3342641 RepID=UPI0039BC717C
MAQKDIFLKSHFKGLAQIPLRSRCLFFSCGNNTVGGSMFERSGRSLQISIFWFISFCRFAVLTVESARGLAIFPRDEDVRASRDAGAIVLPTEMGKLVSRL